jgi:hypothetical protein
MQSADGDAQGAASFEALVNGYVLMQADPACGATEALKDAEL